MTGTGTESWAGGPARRAALVAGIVLAAAAGCADEEIGPGDGDGYPVWIAQEINGTVRAAFTQDPLGNATIQILAGFSLDALLPIGSGTSRSDGTFRIRRSDTTGIPGDFWWFVVDEPFAREVIVQLDVRHGGYLPATPRQTVTRQPSREVPDFNLGVYTLTYNVSLVLAQEP